MSTASISILDNTAPEQGNASEECLFCFETYCNDGQDCIQCACGNWIHEDCLEELFVDSFGQERFYPTCMIAIISCIMFFLELNLFCDLLYNFLK